MQDLGSLSIEDLATLRDAVVAKLGGPPSRHGSARRGIAPRLR
jgi:hypothetical protein